MHTTFSYRHKDPVSLEHFQCLANTSPYPMA